jgi:hypothetical protein
VQLELVRDIETPYCTLGRLHFAGRSLFTIERAWVPDPRSKGGTKGISCVPLGDYRLDRHNSDAHPKVWALVNPLLDVYHWPDDVPPSKELVSRTACLIHAANWAHELRGCIAPGKTRIKDARGRWMVTNSREAINDLRTVIGTRYEVSLTIVPNTNGIEAHGGKFGGGGANAEW